MCHSPKPDTQQMCKKCNFKGKNIQIYINLHVFFPIGLYQRQNFQHIQSGLMKDVLTRSRETSQGGHNLNAILSENDTSKLREVQQQATLEWTVSAWSEVSPGFQLWKNSIMMF